MNLAARVQLKLSAVSSMKFAHRRLPYNNNKPWLWNNSKTTYESNHAVHNHRSDQLDNDSQKLS